MGRQILVPAMDYALVCELDPVPLCHGPGAPRIYYLKQLPMNKRAFVEVQISREVLTHH